MQVAPIQVDDVALARGMMDRFAQETGISDQTRPPRRYLWTDAFAVCNFLQLHRELGEAQYLQYAVELVDQVHNVLGRHRSDDSRSGWISGLDEAEGRAHPTIAGLRIGKSLPERFRDAPIDERLEWERDGQYYHYLTKWMHALNRMNTVTGEAVYGEWAWELARSAHAAFGYPMTRGGRKRLCWKMSIDLSYPLVTFSGQHDPLDGLVTYLELRANAKHQDLSTSALEAEVVELAEMCEGANWSTDDPLGIGGLLFDACRVLQIGTDTDDCDKGTLVSETLDASLRGLNHFSRHGTMALPVEQRLAFRELGLAIGLRAVTKMQDLVRLHGSTDGLVEDVSRKLHNLSRYASVGEAIEATWRLPANRQSPQWKAHEDINAVMLATALIPDMFLSI